MRRTTYLSLIVFILLSLVFAATANAAPAHANRGAWAPNIWYNVGDTVTYNGSTYTTIQAHTSLLGWEPPNVPALWQLTTGGGGPTSTPTRTNTPGSGPTSTRTPTRTNTPGSGTGCWTPWVSTTAYTGGARVSYSSQNYQAAYWTQGDTPDTHSGPAGSGQPWIPMGSCGGGGGPTSTPTRTPTQGTGTGFTSIVSEAQFNQMFPNRNPFYTYQGLVTAAAFYPAFAGTGDIAMKRREAAAALANFSHETGGLFYIVEQNTANYPYYCDPNWSEFPCAPGKQYYGRGPIQLSWNFNYGRAGQALGLPLLTNPDLVAQDASVAWKTALWYWMTQTGPGTMTPHNAIVNGYGFGETIRSINGSLECNGGNPAQVQSRINSFNNFISILGTTAGPGNIGC